MKNCRGQFTRNLEHVGDHQQQSLAGSKGSRERAGLQRAVNGAGSAAFACCDLYGNAEGDVAGLDDPVGSDGNISANPLFCEIDAPDLPNVGLAQDSPCLPENKDCGVLMGAWGQGCGVYYIHVPGDYPTIQAGLAAAGRLSASGVGVTVLDKGRTVGGRMAVTRMPTCSATWERWEFTPAQRWN